MTTNPAAWDQLGGFAAVQAAGAESALELLDARLASATNPDERVAAFEDAYQQVADWRYQVAVQRGWMRPGSTAEDLRTKFDTGARSYLVTPTDGGREPGSPAFKLLTELEGVVHDRLHDPAEQANVIRTDEKVRLHNQVRLRDGRTMYGNVLVQSPGETLTVTAKKENRDVLRRAAFEALAELETKRAEGGQLDPQDPELRQAFTDAAYFMSQAPEFLRGSDAIMRTFLVAAHTRVFDAAPVLPQAIDLDGMVRGQDGFNKVMREELRVLPQSAAPSPAVGRAPAEVAATRTGERVKAAQRTDGVTR